MPPRHRRQSSLEQVIDYGGSLAPQPARSLHRHQDSLQAAEKWKPTATLTETEREQGIRRFNKIISHFEKVTEDEKKSGKSPEIQYDRCALIRYTHEFALSERSKDAILSFFFDFVGHPVAGDDEIVPDQSLRDDFEMFGNTLMDNFFLPMKTAGGQTAQPTPKFESAIANKGLERMMVGTPDRLSSLRGSCLTRDHFRCIVTHKFEVDEAERRTSQHGTAATDGYGTKLIGGGVEFDALEVAHILPRALYQSESETNPELSKRRQAALHILDLFDYGVLSLIEGVEIDNPRNALSLSTLIHKGFGRFKIYFEEAPPSSPGATTYHVKSFKPFYAGVPTTCTLFDTHQHIPLPSKRLLAIHRAIAHILHLSGAGEYIDRLLRDLESSVARADGSTDLSEIVNLRLGGWWGGAVRA